MTSKALALALAGVAVALAGTALVVVVTRSREIVRAPPAPASRPAMPDAIDVAAADVAALPRDPGVQYTDHGAYVTNQALAARLHLEPGDAILALSGRAIRGLYDIECVVTLDGEEVIAQLERHGAMVLERWKLEGHLSDQRPDVTSAISSAVPPPPPPLPPPVPPDPLLDTIVRDDDTHVHVPRATVEALLADPTKASTGARIVPAVRNGAPDGFKLYGIRPGSIATRLGLQNGDTIHAINGLQLTTADSALVVYPQLRNAIHLDVSIERRGVPMMISIQIN